MNLKLFYSPPKWKAFIAPEKPRQWDYESGGEPPFIAAYLDNGYFYALEAYEKAYAEAKANALEVGNEDAIMQKFYGSTSNLSDGVEFDWPCSAVIKDGKYILSI